MTTVMAAAAVPDLMMRIVLSLGGGVVTMNPGEDGGDEEEDAVHDAEGKAGLEHRTGLVDRDIHAVDRGGTEDAKADIKRVAPRQVCAVGVGDESQVVYCSDEGTDEAQVDECDKLRIATASVVAEEGEDRPGKSKHRDDEDDQNVVGRQEIVIDIAVHEPGQHAHGGNLVTQRH